jgi:DNA processing protein
VDSPTQIDWLKLARWPEVLPRARIAWLARLGSPQAVLGAPSSELKSILAEHYAGYLDPVVQQSIDSLPRNADLDEFKPDLNWLEQDHRHLVAWHDPLYPRLLREIPNPPLALYLMGDPQILIQPQIAIVGSRNASPAGKENARAFARALSDAGLVVTSGMALGIDGAAHAGALDAGGKTIAVCGTGLDRVYPARHRDLAHAIVKNGALLSEFPIGSPPLPGHFPVRNRLISGLSLGVLVVEAALESGSLITARLAAEHGRDVFAIPGSIHSPLSRGCHALIRQGAKLVETANDIVEELGALAQLTSFQPSYRPTPDENFPLPVQDLLGVLGYDPVALDVLVERSGLTIDVVSSMLVELELEGVVATIPGGRFQRVR